MAALSALFMPAVALAGTKLPLPQSRPAAAPAPDDKEARKGAPAMPGTSPSPSACRLALTDAVAVAPSIPAIKGPGACGGDDLVRLEAVVLTDRSRVAVKPAATLRCPMASAIADWIRTDMAPLAEGLGSRISELDNFDSFECRGRNRVAGAKLSEHGRANALDVRAVRLSDGRVIALTDRSVPRELRETVLKSVCARFTTVLGPGSDGYHEDHIHLDLAERRNGYRICHWEIHGPMPAVAPLPPAERPAEASRRETEETADKTSKTSPKRETTPLAASQAAPAAALPMDVVPKPRKRSAAADAADKTMRGSSEPPPPPSAQSTRFSAAKPVKRRRKRRIDLPPFLRRLLD
ncbi:extensin-like domain-containing protein [Nitrobacter sp.]|uniref:extensin-like domain-containing protein n=1 Tax=Nitrobacter sp. TaxID=29420 RepID=UPI00399D65AA